MMLSYTIVLLLLSLGISQAQDRCSYTCYTTESYRTKCGIWSWNTCTRYRVVSRTCHKYCTHGGWSTWQRTYGDCSVPCGGGTQLITETRTCDNPAPANGGRYCVGINERRFSQGCNANPCPINGGWGDWNAWRDTSDCDALCAGGRKSQTRDRVCDSPPPAHGGNDCEGASFENQVVDCNTFTCDDLCVNGVTYIPHRNLVKFWQCSNGVAHEMTCAPGTYWNRDIPVCDHLPAKEAQRIEEEGKKADELRENSSV